MAFLRRAASALYARHKASVGLLQAFQPGAWLSWLPGFDVSVASAEPGSGGGADRLAENGWLFRIFGEIIK